MVWYSVNRVLDLDDVKIAELDHLDLACLPGDDPYPKAGPGLYWWIVTEHPRGRVVGFCGSLYWGPESLVFLCRSGVMPEARGKGLQRRMIKTRVAHAAYIGAKGCISYTSTDNTVSSNNLIRCGFELYEPEYKWAGEEYLYWWRTVVPSRRRK